MDILTNYTFQIIAFGTALLAAVAAPVGALSVYKGQSLIGDAIGHATFPGVVLAYMAFSTREPAILFVGAMAAAAATFFAIEGAHENSHVGLNANLAIFLSGFFGLGMVLKSYIQGNPAYRGASQAGLETYIFGQAAYMLEGDVLLIAGVAAAALLLLLLFYKECKVFVFDTEYAQAAGLSAGLLRVLLPLLTVAVIGVGLKAVGAILISSFLIIPCVAASQWSNDFSRVLFLSSLFGVAAAFAGTYVSTAEQGMSTGPSIILAACAIAFFSLLFGKRGILRARSRRTAKGGRSA
ncbi:MAG: metal ABC transporter permease [Schwartzia sp. (in: firmicutes)]